MSALDLLRAKQDRLQAEKDEKEAQRRHYTAEAIRLFEPFRQAIRELQAAGIWFAEMSNYYFALHDKPQETDTAYTFRYAVNHSVVVSVYTQPPYGQAQKSEGLPDYPFFQICDRSNRFYTDGQEALDAWLELVAKYAQSGPKPSGKREL